MTVAGCAHDVTTAVDKALLELLWGRGMTIREAAIVMGCSPSTVSRRLRAMGRGRGRGGARRRVLDAATVARRLREGASQAAIAREFKVSRQAVHRIAKKLGNSKSESPAMNGP